MVKRGTWIEEYRSRYPDTILVDSGDSLVDATDLKKAKSIYDAFSILKYDAYLPGESDLSLGVQSFLDSSRELRLVGTNFVYNPGLFQKNQTFGSKEIILEKNQLQIRILGYLDEETLLYANERIKSSINFLKDERVPKRNPKTSLTIALTHSGLNKDKKWISDIDFPLVVIGGHDQFQPKEGAGYEVYGGIWYFQAGADGNQIGEIVLDLNRDGSFRILSHKLHSIDYGSTPDHSQIRDMIINLRR